MSTLNITAITSENPLTIAAAMALPDSEKLLLLEAFLSGNLVARGENVIPKPLRETGPRGQTPAVAARSEEHTSELQSH